MLPVVTKKRISNLILMPADQRLGKYRAEFRTFRLQGVLRGVERAVRDAAGRGDGRGRLWRSSSLLRGWRREEGGRARD